MVMYGNKNSIFLKYELVIDYHNMTINFLKMDAGVITIMVMKIMVSEKRPF